MDGGQEPAERPCVRRPSQSPAGPAARTRGRPLFTREVSIEQLAHPQSFQAKSFQEIRAAAQQLAPAALETLGEIMRGKGSDTARLAAAREVLDRAHGKARARSEGGGDDDEQVTVVVRRFGDRQEED